MSAGRVLAILLCVSSAVSAATIPGGTRLAIRLGQGVSSFTSRAGDPIPATLISPVIVEGRILLPAGLPVSGKVEALQTRKRPDRSRLLLTFGTLTIEEHKTLPFEAKVAEVDNARESVDADGVIHGLRHVTWRPAGVEDLLLLAAVTHPAVLASLAVGKFIVAEHEKPRVRFPSGTELWVQLTAPLIVPENFTLSTQIANATYGTELNQLVGSLPLRTTAGAHRLSDLINVAILGSEDSVTDAFKDAGWSKAASLDLRTEAEMFFSLAIHHSYHAAPVSSLLLEGKPPTHVFEKSLNTLSKRHHIRVWRTGEQFEGEDVWVCAATHDTGIEFSRQVRMFSHSVQGDIDFERQKVVDDLALTGSVKDTVVVPRADAPQDFRIATGAKLRTDGAIAVLRLKN